MHVHGFFPSICCNDEDDDDDADDDVGLRDEQLTGLGGWFPRKVFVVTQCLAMAKEVFPAENFFLVSHPCDCVIFRETESP